jgi:hypothetical protein
VWYQHGVRIPALFAVAVLAAGCGDPSGSSSSVASAPSASSSAALNPARIDRAREQVPEGFEFTDVDGRVSPAAQWGLRSGWSAEPPHCGLLADPVPAPATSAGWSASGAGGVVYAVVAGPVPHPFDPAVVAECGQWAVQGGRTAGTVTVRDAAAVDDAPAVAMSVAATTVVEGGTETHAHAETVTAYVGDHAVSVTVVTDPGSPNPQLGQDFAAALLATSVAALRG